MTTKTLTCFSFPKEMELMLSLALRNTCHIPEDFDEKYFKAMVEKNRIEPLVAEGTKNLPKDTFKKYPVFSKLQSQQNSYYLYAMRQMQVLASLMIGFEANGIRALSLKGPLLGVELYGNPALRYSRDLDILVSEADFTAASAYMEASGYKEEITIYNKTPKRHKKYSNRDKTMHTEYHKDGICVELHWRISFRIDESFDDLWERRRTRKLLGHDIPILGKADDLIYLICHAAGHAFFRQRWLLDLYELLNDTGISQFELYNAHAQRGMGMVFLETLLVLYLYPVFEMPDTHNELFTIQRKNGEIIVAYDDTLEADIQAAFRLINILSPLLIKETEDIGITGRRYINLLPELSKKKSTFRAVLNVFEPSRADLELIDLPDPLFFLYYIIRPFHKLYRLMPIHKNKNGDDYK